MSSRIPKYCHHKSSGRGYVRLGTRSPQTFLPGAYNSPESLAAYHRAIAEWESRGRPDGQAASKGEVVTVNRLIRDYFVFAQARYRKGGKPTSEIGCIKSALRPLRELYGETLAANFGLPELERVRDAMTRRKARNGLPWTRRSCNRHLSRVKQAFRWGARQGLVPVSVVSELREAEGVRIGSGHARETVPVQPVSYTDIEQTTRGMPQILQDMVWVQYLTGMRSGQLLAMEWRHIETNGPVWCYRVPDKANKSLHHGAKATYHLGQRAQAILSRYRNVLGPLWKSRCGTYTPNGYRILVGRWAKRNGVPVWHPHQLRHSHATEVRKQYGLEAARAALGHRSVTVTEIYAEQDSELAKKIAAAIG